MLKKFHRLYRLVKFQAVGWDSWVPTALKSIFRGEPILESAAWFYVSIVKFIFTPTFEIKIHEKNFFCTKIISFSKLSFDKLTHT